MQKFKRASDRLQVNIKLSLDHSQKIAELLSYYNDKNIHFLGAVGDASSTANAHLLDDLFSKLQSKKFTMKCSTSVK